MLAGAWSAGLFFSFDWAVALAEEADVTVRAAQEMRAIDQDYLDVLFNPADGSPAAVTLPGLREPIGTEALPDCAGRREPLRRYA